MSRPALKPRGWVRGIDSLAFVGTEALRNDSGSQEDLECCVSEEIERLDRRLNSQYERNLSSLICLDVFYDPTIFEATHVEKALSSQLPEDCRPCVMFIPTAGQQASRRSLSIQAISTGCVIESGDPERFPASVAAGDVVVISGHATAISGDITAQSHDRMRALQSLLHRHNATLADVAKFNIYYVGFGTVDDWAIAARVRAQYFDEPGPVATGIPVSRLPHAGEEIAMKVLAVRGKRDGSSSEFAQSWPSGHWDWPFHLPYRHGWRCSATAFVGGQVSLTSRAEVIDSGDFAAQVRRSLGNIEKVLAPFNMDSGDLLQLTAFFSEGLEARTTLAAIFDEIVGASDLEVSLVGLPRLAYEGMDVEIEAAARYRSTASKTSASQKSTGTERGPL